MVFLADDTLGCLEISLRTDRKKTRVWDFVCRGWGSIEMPVFTAARIVENGLSHPQDCILHSENCLPLPFPGPLSKPITMG